MYKDTGRMPDIHGSPHFKRQYQTKFTDSIMVEPSGRIRLVDVDMLGLLWHPNPFGKVHMFLHRRGLAKLVKKNWIQMGKGENEASNRGITD